MRMPKRGQAVDASVFIGVYSSLTQGPQEGRGAGKRKQYWFVWDCGDAGYSVQMLDGAFQPHGEVLPIEPATLRASFSPESSIFAAPSRRHLVPASPPPRQEAGHPLSKTLEPFLADRVEVEDFLRAHFGALLLKVRRGDDLPATFKALQDIAEVEEGIIPEHKYMFSEFGVSLRKGKLPELALAHAKRVLSLDPGDSHAHFNIARIYYTLGKLSEAEQHLLTALEFSPDLEYARMFLAYIGKERRQKVFSDDRRRHR